MSRLDAQNDVRMLLIFCMFANIGAAVAEAVKERTETYLKKLGGVAVSSKPIVMKAEFAYCPNLTIIGTCFLCLLHLSEDVCPLRGAT